VRVSKRWVVRFKTAPDAAARRRVERCFDSAPTWDGAQLGGKGAPDEDALAAADALWPIEVIDRGRGDGWEPFGSEEPEDAGGLDMTEVDAAPRPEPPAAAPEVAERYVFDDYLLVAPDGRHVAFVRDEARCHFAALDVIDGDETRRVPLPALNDYPRHAWSHDGRLLIGGHADVMELDLATGELLQLFHEPGASAIDVCWVGPRRVAAASFRHLLIADLDGQKVALRRYPCQGGRLVRAVLGGRVLLVGTDGGTAALGIDGDRVRRLGVDWRSLADAWDEGDRVLALGAHGKVMDVRGLDAAWSSAFAHAGADDPDPLGAPTEET
jgi:hypothetical protein